MSVTYALNSVWVVLTAALVLFMEGGFSLLEAGLVRTRNAVNVTMKIFVDLTFGALVFYLLGSHVLFGRHDVLHLFGLGALVSHPALSPTAFMLFQIGFAVAAVSIISGAVAERMKFSVYIVVVIVVAALIYPLSGHWIWGPGGWLAQLGFEDFAGSAAIHALGGFMALALAWVVGPRQSRFNSDGSANVFAPSNIPLASAGAFILLFGWFGFNAGSTLNAFDPRLPTIALNTMLASAAGGMSAMLVSMYRFKAADPSMTINGALSGLVAITAGCAFVAPWAAILIGLAAGVLVIYATGWVDKIGIDDPVGAFAVHGMGGVFGTLAVGLFDVRQGLLTTGNVHLLLVQALGIAVVAVWGFGAAWALGTFLKRTIGIRISPDLEDEGMDIVAHGIPAYNDLERFSEGERFGLPKDAALRHPIDALD